jgi:hypothetical protein
MRAAIYLRVSTGEQTTDNQERELRAAAKRIGHEIVAVYRDAGIPGSKGRDRRPGFDAMHKDAARRQERGSRAGGVMGDNLFKWWPCLSEKERQAVKALGFHEVSDRQRAIDGLLKAASCYRAAYAIIAVKLQGPPYTQPPEVDEGMPPGGSRPPLSHGSG